MSHVDFCERFAIGTTKRDQRKGMCAPAGGSLMELGKTHRILVPSPEKHNRSDANDNTRQLPLTVGLWGGSYLFCVGQRQPGRNDAEDKSRSLGFSPGAHFSSPLKSQCFLKDGAEQECSGYGCG